MVENGKGKKALGKGKVYGKENAMGEKALPKRSAYGKERRVGKQTVQESNTPLKGVSRWGAIKVGKNQQNLIPCPLKVNSRCWTRSWHQAEFDTNSALPLDYKSIMSLPFCLCSLRMIWLINKWKPCRCGVTSLGSWPLDLTTAASPDARLQYAHNMEVTTLSP